MKINKNIFRDYDIRGIAGIKFEPELIKEYEKWYGKFPGLTINLETSKAIGKAYGTLIKREGGTKVVIGYEIRPYADKLKESFIEGVLETGIDVSDADKTTTPLIYFLIPYLKFDGGVSITGSHNVYFYNGFKLMKRNTTPIYGQELQEMYKIIKEDSYELSSVKGKLSKLPNPFSIYKKYLLDHIKLARRLKVVIDCGNGTPGLYAVELFTALGCEVTGMYLEPDAHFPNHVPDPEAPQNMKDLSKKVVELGADIGIGFDADGDRAGFIDEKGNLILPDNLILLLSRDILSRNKGKKILYDVKCTHVLEELIPTFGGIPLMHRTGHAPIKDTLRKDLDIILGGETSGHFFFVEDYFRIDDGFYAAAYILKLLSESKVPFSKMFDFIPKRIRTHEIKLPCDDKVKFKVVDAVRNIFKKKYKCILLDGVRVVFDDKSWGLVRASNTSPYLTIKVEAPTEEGVIKIKNILADVLDNYPEIQDRLDRKNVVSFTGKLGWL